MHYWPHYSADDLKEMSVEEYHTNIPWAEQLCDICGIDTTTTGSHYHCAQCGKTSSMLGHYVRLVRPGDKKWAERLGLPWPFEGFTCEVK